MLDLGTVDTDPAVLARAKAVSAGFGARQQLAERMAIAHRYAADYIEQAPVLVLAVHNARMHAHTTTLTEPANVDPDMKRVERRTRAELAAWMHAVALGHKLPALMKLYGVAPQFRALKRGACIPSAFWPIRLMTRQMQGHEIASIIPRNVVTQSVWLRSLVGWYRNMLRRGGSLSSGLDNAECLTRWAARAIGLAAGESRLGAPVAAEVSDFAIAMGRRFDQRWTFLQAADACGRWHNRRGDEMNELGFVQSFGVQPDWEAPPLGFPDRITMSDGWGATLLRTGRDLWREHCALRHCVDTYFADVMRGCSRIYSIDKDGEKIATVEFRTSLSVEPFTPGSTDRTANGAPLLWYPSQFQAKGNTKPPEAAWDALALSIEPMRRAGIRFQEYAGIAEPRVEDGLRLLRLIPPGVRP